MDSLPRSCRAVVLSATQTLELGTTPLPELSDNQILIRVRAAGVNHADIYQRKGEYPVPAGASPILGLEVAGEVAACGKSARWKRGDRVMALVTGGAYAEYCVADSETTLPLPATLSFVQGACIPESYFTIWSNVFAADMAALKPGETLLVHGGASGVGSATIQLAKLHGAKVLATAGTPQKCQACIELGADLAIPYKTRSFFDEAKTFTHNQGVDVIFDWVGTSYFESHIRLLKRFGRLVVIDSHTGDDGKLDLLRLLSQNLHVMGSVLRRRPLIEKARICQEVERAWLSPLSAGTLAPLVHGVFPLDQAQRAHDLMEKSGHTGKIVLEVD